jgi:hypothetical protein
MRACCCRCDSTSNVVFVAQVQHARMMAAHLELGTNMVDMLRIFQAAAHEEIWEALFADLR